MCPLLSYPQWQQFAKLQYGVSCSDFPSLTCICVCVLCNVITCMGSCMDHHS